MQPDHVVVIAGSAGSFGTLLRQLDRLTFRDNACLFLAYHRSAGPAFDWNGALPPGTSFQAAPAKDGEPVRVNTVYYPRGGEDIAVRRGRIVATPAAGPYRPRIDALLASLAEAYDSRVVAVLLSGSGWDGVEGLRRVAGAGGATLVQDPDEASFPQLPRAAIAAGVAQRVRSTEGILLAVEEILHGAPPHRAVHRPEP